MIKKFRFYWFRNWWNLRKKHLKLQKECRKLRRQRDCLHKYLERFALAYFRYEILPEELTKILDEIEGEDDKT